MASENRRTHHQVTFAVLAASVSAYALLQSLVTPVLPTIQQDLHTNQNTVTWVLTAYLLSASIFTPIMGRIGDILGKERVFVATLGALAAGSLLAALATNVSVMIIARVIQGVGGGVLPLAFGIVRDEFPREKMSAAVGAIASLTAVGAGLGIVLAGPIVNALDYHWLFWLPMILTVAAAVAAAFFIPKSPVRTPGRISWLPAVLLSAWLVALLVALSQAPVWGWASGKVIGLFVAAVVLAVGWVEVERRAAMPLIDMTMMRRPAVWTNNLVALLFGVGMYATFAFLPEFVQSPKSTGYGFGASITQSGLILLPMTVTMFLVGLKASGFAARVGGKTVVLLGSLIATVSLALLAFAHTHTWELYVATAVMGVGFGLAFAAMSSLIVSAVPPEQTGVASGMNANIRTIGGSIGAALMASVVTANPAADGLPREAGYTHGFAMLGGALLIAALAAALIPANRGGSRITFADESPHAELALAPGGTVVGETSE
ncbi:drug resistance transporter, EmrB/QacA subfamily [Streptomyces sp. DvalAA-14]|uniref:MFS transporter n=1 Tax=unclassified Streptomyces TaxID=2593676 RepID=UPI00081AF339|nr:MULTISPECIES: MFS transporter [unclassified Streptomyces]MYS18949.1 MFS transporter [Streptomyces sp. SID4948]SCD32441.1 drug resistance transporter, EmrB/QacA subfamily [Streptomyces sp. DvalAA-14]